MKSLFPFFIFLIGIILFPIGVGIHFFVDIRLWSVLGFVLLLPLLIQEWNSDNIKMERIDLLMFLLILLSAIPQFFLNDTNPLTLFINRLVYLYFPYLIAKNLIIPDVNFMKLLKIFIIGSILVSFIGLYEYVNETNVFRNALFLMVNPKDDWQNSAIQYSRFEQIRITAGFNHPIYLGTFVIFVLIMSLILLIIRQKQNLQVSTPLIIVQIFLALTVALLSQSRTAIIGLLIIVPAIVLITQNKYLVLLKLSAIMIIIVLAMFIFFSDYLITFYFNNIVGERADENWVGRGVILDAAFAYVGSFINFFGESIKGHNEVYNYMYSTDMLNGFLNSYLFYGLFYCIIYIYVWIASIVKSYKMSKINTLSYIPLFALLYYFIVNNITAITFQNEIIFFILVGLSFNRNFNVENILVPQESEVQLSPQIS
jgi:O-Antigen ligase